MYEMFPVFCKQLVRRSSNLLYRHLFQEQASYAFKKPRKLTINSLPRCLVSPYDKASVP